MSSQCYTTVPMFLFCVILYELTTLLYSSLCLFCVILHELTAVKHSPLELIVCYFSLKSQWYNKAPTCFIRIAIRVYVILSYGICYAYIYICLLLLFIYFIIIIIMINIILIIILLRCSRQRPKGVSHSGLPVGAPQQPRLLSVC
jgi:hypothetical protein